MNRPSDPEELTDWDRGWDAGYQDGASVVGPRLFKAGADHMRELIASLVEDTDPKLSFLLRAIELSMDEAEDGASEFLIEQEIVEDARYDGTNRVRRRLIHHAVEGWVVDVWQGEDEDSATRWPLACGERFDPIQKKIKGAVAAFDSWNGKAFDIPLHTVTLSPEDCVLLKRYIAAYPKLAEAPDWVQREIVRAHADLTGKFAEWAGREPQPEKPE